MQIEEREEGKKSIESEISHDQKCTFWKVNHVFFLAFLSMSQVLMLFPQMKCRAIKTITDFAIHERSAANDVKPL
jgi:hypothetical protein